MASRHYPIWNDVTACIYKGNKSWGAQDCSEVNVKVGSSAKNSHQFVNIVTKKIVTDEHIIFKFYLDEVKMKEMTFENNRGKCGPLVNSARFFNF